MHFGEETGFFFAFLRSSRGPALGEGKPGGEGWGEEGRTLGDFQPSAQLQL